MKISKNKRLWLAVAGVAVMLLVGLAVFYSSKHKDNAVAGVTPQPSASASSNSSPTPATSSTPTPTPTNSKFSPTPTPTQVSGIVVSIDTITPRDGGILGVANTILGATSGTCVLELTDPDQQKTTFPGTVDTNGPTYFCSLGTISGVTKTGKWTAKLSASSNGATGSTSKDFTK